MPASIHRSGSSRFAVAVAVLALAGTVPLVAAVPAVAQANTLAAATAPPPAPGNTPAPPTSDGAARVTWGVGPVTRPGVPERAAFVHRLEPGRAVSDVVRVSNFSDAPLSFQVYAHDAVNTKEGGFDLLAADEAPRGIGSWVRLAQRSVTVPARSHLDVPFRIEVPADATPGDHTGGVVAAVTGRSTDAGGRSVLVERRVGSRIYLRVPGAIRSSLATEGLAATYSESFNPLRPGHVTVTYAMRNTGNVRLGAEPRVSVTDSTGRVERAADGIPVREILPGQTVTGRTEIRGVWPLTRMTVRVESRGIPAPGATEETPAPRTAPASTTVWAIPWTALVLLAVLVLVVVRWRRRRPAVEPDALAATPELTKEPA